jgi:hypothetical protein
MNTRSKTTAMVLCFFFGLFGLHWLYLGRGAWMALYIFLLFGVPVLWVGTMIGLGPNQPDWSDGVSAIALFLHGGVYLLALHDFFYLIGISPGHFDAVYNTYQ